MQEPSVRTSRLAITGALLAAMAVGGAGFLVGRNTAPAAPPEEIQLPEPVPTPSPIVQITLARADLLAIARGAADAFASGTALPISAAEATGQRFDLSLPFGCDGQSEDPATPMRWSYDEARNTLRVSATLHTWNPQEWELEPPSDTNAIEGFWIVRPWSSSGECPPVVIPQTTSSDVEADRDAVPSPSTLPAQTLAPARQTVAIAQFPSPESSGGAGRDRRPFEAVIRVPADRFDASQGFRLRVTGRIASAPGGGNVLCIQPGGKDQPPSCVIAATFNEVSIENPATGETLGTWPFARSVR